MPGGIVSLEIEAGVSLKVHGRDQKASLLASTGGPSTWTLVASVGIWACAGYLTRRGLSLLEAVLLGSAADGTRLAAFGFGEGYYLANIVGSLLLGLWVRMSVYTNSRANSPWGAPLFTGFGELLLFKYAPGFLILPARVSCEAAHAFGSNCLIYILKYSFPHRNWFLRVADNICFME